MKIPVCEVCGAYVNLQRHHKFSKTKPNKKLYGKKLLDSEVNIQVACMDCHASHRSEKLTQWTELQFCEATGIKPKSRENQAWKS